jgi:hypothetical protein
VKSQGQIHVHILAMLRKESNIIELNILVYKERHDVEKQARVDDDWMMNIFGLTAIHPGRSTDGVLDRTKIGKPEGTCETHLVTPYLKNCHRLQITNLIYATCAIVVKCTIAADTVYIIKKGE